MSTSTTHSAASFTNEDVAALTRDRVVRVSVGTVEMAMRTDLLSGVFQLSGQHRLTERNTVQTAKGEYQVVSLAEALSKNFGIEPDPSFRGRALIAVEYKNDVVMLRADSVSRPTVITPEHVHPLPKIANPTDSNRLVRFVANVDPREEDPLKAIRWIFEPLVAIGDSVPDTGNSAFNPLPKEAASAVAANNQESQLNRSRGTGQLLAFVPNDVLRSEMDYAFCLPLNAVAEVITTSRQIDSRFSNPFFDGFILWRKVPVPIVRLGRIFGCQSEDEEAESGRRLVVARATGNRFIGFYAKSQMQTMKVPKATPYQKPSLDQRPHRGCFRTELGDIVVPDIDRILSADFS